MRKDTETVTKLQHKLFFCLKYIHSNIILIPKFRHLSTCGNWVLGHLFCTLWPDLWSKCILTNILVVGSHFEQGFMLVANMQIIFFQIHSESVYLLKVSLDLQTGKN